MEAITHGLAGLFLPQVAALLSGLLGFFGLGLAVVGIYGVVSFGVSRRTRELGIRMALGAAPAGVLKLVAGQGALLAAMGIAVGLTGALLASRGLSKLLFGVSATNPAIYGLVSLIIAGVVILACYFPARSATRVNPADALRSE
jgi:ABC-type antimicrobial peptide transport system permease subunit